MPEESKSALVQKMGRCCQANKSLPKAMLTHIYVAIGHQKLLCPCVYVVFWKHFVPICVLCVSGVWVMSCWWWGTGSDIEGILPKGPYLPCVSMAGRALLAGYHRYQGSKQGCNWYSRVNIMQLLRLLTHGSRYKMAFAEDILKRISGIKMFEFRLIFHRGLFRIHQDWCRQWLGSEKSNNPLYKPMVV